MSSSSRYCKVLAILVFFFIFSFFFFSVPTFVVDGDGSPNVMVFFPPEEEVEAEEIGTHESDVPSSSSSSSDSSSSSPSSSPYSTIRSSSASTLRAKRSR